MITLLASIAGFITSIVPEIIKYFKDLNDKKHELDILEKQIKFSNANTARTLQEIQISQDIIEQASLYSTYKTDIKWVDTLNGSVRPILASCFFLLYMGVKYLQYKAIASTAHVIEYLEVIWNVDDQAIFAGIISFYYGHRTFRKIWKNKL